jgi:deazaflavin-dependent oxidoreductase (nitroreductase family)
MSYTAFDESKVINSPVGWVADHIKDYVETDGRQGHSRADLNAETLLLTVQGRKSGNWHRTGLAYQPDGENYVVGASNGGAAQDPTWYLNLSKNPEVHVQVGPDKFTARASVARGEERARLWSKLVKSSADYETFQAATDREIPVVVLEPVR